MCVTTLSSANAAHPGLSVGAIRWDPWYEPEAGGEREAVERSLAPAAFHGRAPSCATSAAPDQISFAGCANQARMDYEIGEAHRAGLDYWAYCWYRADNRMQEAWRLHQASTIRSQVNWCLLLSSFQRFAAEVRSNTLQTLAGYVSQANYQQVGVADGRRPLVYILDDGTGADGLPDAVSAFRTACSATGSSPYIVLLGSDPSTRPGSAQAAGADAVGTYAYGRPAADSPYPALAQVVEAHWAEVAATHQPMVPTAMTGWDRRPRIQTPVPWEHPTPANTRKDNFYQPGTPAQIAAHVGAMLAWIRANRAACPAQTGLIYSWDEHDEGGGCLNPSAEGGDAVLAAVARAL